MREIESVTVLSKFNDRTVKTTQLAEAMGVQKNELPGLWFVYSRGEEIVKWPYELLLALAKPDLVALWVDYCVIRLNLQR